MEAYVGVRYTGQEIIDHVALITRMKHGPFKNRSFEIARERQEQIRELREYTQLLFDSFAQVRVMRGSRSTHNAGSIALP